MLYIQSSNILRNFCIVILFVEKIRMIDIFIWFCLYDFQVTLNAVKNLYSYHYFVIGLADRFEEYPKLKELIRLKDDLIAKTATPPM